MRGFADQVVSLAGLGDVSWDSACGGLLCAGLLGVEQDHREPRLPRVRRPVLSPLELAWNGDGEGNRRWQFLRKPNTQQATSGIFVEAAAFFLSGLDALKRHE